MRSRVKLPFIQAGAQHQDWEKMAGPWRREVRPVEFIKDWRLLGPLAFPRKPDALAHTILSFHSFFLFTVRQLTRLVPSNCDIP